MSKQLEDLDDAASQSELATKELQSLYGKLQQLENFRANMYNRMLEWREIYTDFGDTVCGQCSGSGIKSYQSTSTWRGGIGGSTITPDVCDSCWGSGCENRKWTDLRKLK